LPLAWPDQDTFEKHVCDLVDDLLQAQPLFRPEPEVEPMQLADQGKGHHGRVVGCDPALPAETVQVLPELVHVLVFLIQDLPLPLSRQELDLVQQDLVELGEEKIPGYRG
jgi:hypothetical protein